MLANWLYCNVDCHVFRNRQRKILRCKCIMLETYIFRQTSEKFLTKTDNSTIVETEF